MKRNVIFILIVMMALLVITGCSKNELQGKWYASDGNSSIEFAEDGVVVVDEIYAGQYAILEDGRLTITVNTAALDDIFDINIVTSYTIDEECLILENVGTSNAKVIYFNETIKEQIINQKYREKYIAVNNTGEFVYETIGYTEDGIAFEIYDEETSEQNKENIESYLRDNYVKTCELAEKEIMPYFDVFPYGNFVMYANNVVGIDGLAYQEVELVFQETGDTAFKFVIDPEYEDIWMWNMDNDTYSVWDGTMGLGVITEKVW